jgi:hypothetical protein
MSGQTRWLYNIGVSWYNQKSRPFRYYRAKHTMLPRIVSYPGESHGIISSSVKLTVLQPHSP